jgi:hypothetical protein
MAKRSTKRTLSSRERKAELEAARRAIDKADKAAQAHCRSVHGGIYKSDANCPTCRVLNAQYDGARMAALKLVDPAEYERTMNERQEEL